jgi:hypothetical protein
MHVLLLGLIAILADGPGAARWFSVCCSCVCPISIFAACLVAMVGMCKVFAKAGQPAWAALVPFYNAYILCQIVRKPDWFIWTIIPFVNIYFGILLNLETAKAFGKEVGFAIGMILLPLVFWPILGFGDAKYLYGRRKRYAEEDEDDDYEERPRRRARNEDDDDDDRPRRRRPRDEDDEDDRRIRRRRRDDEDD